MLGILKKRFEGEQNDFRQISGNLRPAVFGQSAGPGGPQPFWHPHLWCGSWMGKKIISSLCAKILCVKTAISKWDFFFFQMTRQMLLIAVVACIMSLLVSQVVSHPGVRPYATSLTDQDRQVRKKSMQTTPCTFWSMILVQRVGQLQFSQKTPPSYHLCFPKRTILDLLG